MSILFKTLAGLNSEPEVPGIKPLTLRNVGTSDAPVSILAQGTPNVDSLQYRMEGEKSWLPYIIGTEIWIKPNEAVQFQKTNEVLSTSTSNYVQFSMPTNWTQINAEGNIQSLLNYSDSVSAYCFSYLFSQCYSLVDASQLELPVTTLVNYCYNGMFSDCARLVNAPELPATILASNCYQNMFQGCTSLVNAPELPATTLAFTCYSFMFQGCTSLVNAPELPATTLVNYCYNYMFFNCSSLVNAPELPATTLVNYCYRGMFFNCSSLVNAPELPATTLARDCYNGMFQGCTRLVNAPELPATTLVNYCYSGMFFDCSSLVNAPELPATTLVNYCYSNMFQGCTNLINAPELPATTLADYCYSRMFFNCSSLKEIKVHFTAYNNKSLSTWVQGVSATGTFYKLTALPEEFGSYRIPSGWTVVNIDAPELPEEDTTDSYIVSGAGLPTVNGEYSLIGEYNGKPLYKMPDVEMYIRYSGTVWQITTIGDSSQAVTPIYYGEGDVPENVTWNAGTGFSPMPTLAKGSSAGGDDSGTSTIAGYRVSGAGTTAANGDYLPAGEYGGRTMYQYGSYQLRFNGNESNPGWQIYDGSNILYFGSGATPETTAWYTTSYPPVPTVTVIAGT